MNGCGDPLSQRRGVLAVRELITAEKAAIGGSGPLDQVTGPTRWALTQKLTVYCLEAQVITSNLGELTDVS